MNRCDVDFNDLQNEFTRCKHCRSFFLPIFAEDLRLIVRHGGDRQAVISMTLPLPAAQAIPSYRLCLRTSVTAQGAQTAAARGLQWKAVIPAVGQTNSPHKVCSGARPGLEPPGTPRTREIAGAGGAGKAEDSLLLLAQADACVAAGCRVLLGRLPQARCCEGWAASGGVRSGRRPGRRPGWALLSGSSRFSGRRGAASRPGDRGLYIHTNSVLPPSLGAVRCCGVRPGLGEPKPGHGGAWSHLAGG
jgi:hypothetical protein